MVERKTDEEQRAESELYWAAGFFDGEGTAGSYGTGQYRSLRVSITQHKSREVLDRFRAAVGNQGYISGPYYGRTSPYWKYQAKHRGARRVINALWPYLSPVKGDQAHDACQRTEACRRIHINLERDWEFPEVAAGLSYHRHHP